MADTELKIKISAKDEASGVLRHIGEVARTALAVAIGQAVVPAVKWLTREMGSFISEATEAEDVQAQLNSVLRSTGGIAGVTADMVNGLAQELASVTKFDEEATISGENLLLTFTNIGQDVFPDATRAMLDMSEALDQDLKSSAIQLGKALNDPIEGVSALQRVGVSFTEAQKEVIASLVETGDVAGAQRLILEELEREFGGAAEAAGGTFAGQMAILKNQLGEAKEVIGAALIPAITELTAGVKEFVTEQLTPWVEEHGPQLQALLVEWARVIRTELVPWIVGLATTLRDLVQQQIIPFVEEHAEALKNALIAIGAVLAAAAIASVIAGIGAAIAALANPITAVILAIGLLAVAWTEDWGGIRTALTEWWETSGRPIFEQMQAWLGVNLPIAIQLVTDFWNNTLYPALLTVWAFIQDSVIPLLGELVIWLGINLPVAAQATVDFWTNTLQPALVAVWAWIQDPLIPTLGDVVTWLGTNVPIAVQAAADFWTTTLQPALAAVWAWIQDPLIPTLSEIVTWLGTNIPKAVQAAADFWQKTLQPSLNAVWVLLRDSVIPTLKELTQTWLTEVKNIATQVAAVWNTVLKPALTAVHGAMSDLSAFISGTFLGDLGNAGGSASSVASAIMSIADAAGHAIGALRDLANAINNMPKPSFGGIPGLASLPGMANRGGTAVGTGIGNWIGNLFKAEGGPVLAGQPYIVGERGPEWFVPKQSGSVLPNGQPKPTTTWNVTINTAQSGTRVIDDLRYLQMLGAMA